MEKESNRYAELSIPLPLYLPKRFRTETAWFTEGVGIIAHSMGPNSAVESDLSAGISG
jgi:hypothetical protein